MARILSRNEVAALLRGLRGGPSVPEEELKTPELCLAAVQNYGGTLEHVPEALKTPELCRAAVQNESLAIRYVPEAHKESVLRRVRKD